MKKILVTGANGFMGQSVLDALKLSSDQFKVLCVGLGAQPTLDDPRFSWVEYDLLDVQGHSKLMQDFSPTHCIHLAWHVPPQEFWHSIKNVEWVYVSVSLFNAFCAQGGKVFLGAGSIAEYDWSAGYVEEKATPLIPSTLYGETKRTLYEMLKHVRNKNFNDVVLQWARIGYFFGECQPRQKLLTKIFDSIAENNSLNVLSAEVSRPYAHVKYLGSALVRLLFECQHDLICNVSASNQYRLDSIVSTIACAIDKNSSCIAYGKYQPPVKEPVTFGIATKIFEDAVGWTIPDTFFADVTVFARALAQGNRGQR